MKPDIHPTYNKNVKVSCVCGNTFVTGATVESINVEICSNCHPFFTGKSKIVDTAGRVDKFKARIEAAKQHKASQPIEKAKVIEVTEPKESAGAEDPMPEVHDADVAHEATEATEAEATAENQAAATETEVAETAEASNE